MELSPAATSALAQAPSDTTSICVASPLSVKQNNPPAAPLEAVVPSRTLSTDAPVSSGIDARQDIRFSAAIETARLAVNEDGSEPLLTTASEKAASFVTTAAASEDCGELLVPTYVGCLETTEDALRLLEGAFRGILQHASQGPRGVPSAVQSGHIFIWEQETSGVHYWDDGVPWIPIDRDGDFWISRETTTGRDLNKMTISIPAQGRFYHLVSYYDPWGTGTLKAPSQDPNLGRMTLRPGLASQVTKPSLSTKQKRLLRATIKVKPSHRITLETIPAHVVQTCSATGHLQLMRNALLLCRCCADREVYEHLLQRTPGDWFPNIPSSSVYYHELASRSLFRGKNRQELKSQMILLLLKLIEASNGRAALRVRFNEPSKGFSAMQNRSLLGEVFRVSHNKPASLRQLDPARLSTDLARSFLFQRCPKMALMDVEKRKGGLMQILPIDPPAHVVSSRKTPIAQL